ncbi:MAG: fibronectin type III domain-containing protein, partial [Chloroflexi bacterium]|nr:fibronectin type III domain-containing protein [Chloroflexota bacterium]
FGAFSCPYGDCLTRRGARHGQGVSGMVRLAVVELVPDRAGRVELALGPTRVVDAFGSVIPVSGVGTRRTLQVGSGSTHFSAPPASYTLPAASRSARRSLPRGVVSDLDHGDAMSVAAAWLRSRELDAACEQELLGGLDLNHDGCLDVGDIQQVAGAIGPGHVGRGNDLAPLERSGAGSSPREGSGSTGGASTQAAGSTAEPTVWTVDSTGDEPDSGYSYDVTTGAHISDGSCASAAGTCTLRAAIQEALASAGTDRIAFAIPGTGVQRIRLGTALPTFNTAPITIDGYSQPGATPNMAAAGSNARILIELEGSGEFSRARCDTSPELCHEALVLTSPGHVVRGLAMFRFWRKIGLYGSGAQRNVIVGNFIGTDAGATHVSPILSQAGYGAVTLSSGASANQVGRPALSDRNVISGNQSYGVWLGGEGTVDNVIANNVMGLSPDGTRALQNHLFAVDINRGASRNRVGGTGTGEANVISGNGSTGIEISHGTETVGNRVEGNLIGTDLSGTGAADYTANGFGGVHVEDGVQDTVVAYNVIGNNGVQEMKGRLQGAGVHVSAMSVTAGTVIAYNHIGITREGAPIGNRGAGVKFWLDAGRTTVGPGNVIAYNPVGVLLEQDASDFVTITRNEIHSNDGPGIELAPVGPNPNGQYATDGPNQRLDHPALTSATPTQVTGRACAGCTVEVFLADRGASQYGQGRSFAGSAVPATDGRFRATVSGLAVGDAVTATATDIAGNTSEFSLNIAVTEQAAPAGAVVLDDTFVRSVSDGWAGSPVGGVYTLSGTSDAYSVSRRVGQITVRAGETRIVFASSVDALNVDASVRVSTDQQAVGGNQQPYLILRRIGGIQYRARVRLDPEGRAFVHAAAFQAGVERSLGPEVRVPGLAHIAGQPLLLRAQATGTNPTTIRVRAWTDGETEPTDWPFTATDDTAALQAPGAVGLRAYLSGGNTNGPIVFGFDGFLVTLADAAAPSNAPIRTLARRATDLEPPTGSVTIASGAAFSRLATVSVDVPATDGDGGSGVAQLRLSNSSEIDGNGLLVAGSTMAYSSPVSWPLTDATLGGSTANGPKTVFVQWQDAAGNWSGVASDDIVYDTVAPTGTVSAASLPAAVQLGTTTVPVRISWSAGDATSGVLSYRLQVSVNDGAYQNVTLPTPLSTTTQQSLTPGSRYRYRIQAHDAAGNWRWVFGQYFRVLAHQESSNALSYTGQWLTARSTTSYGGAMRYASANGRRATFTFTGRAVSWVSQLGPDRGRARVYLDGVQVAFIDLYSPSVVKRRVVFSRSFSSSVSRVLEIRVLGTRGASSTGTRVDLDAVVVLE